MFQKVHFSTILILFGRSFVNLSFEDTHKAIIGKDTWELVQKAREQAELKASADILRPIIQAAGCETVNVQSFLKIVKKYTEPVELTHAILRAGVCEQDRYPCPGQIQRPPCPADRCAL